MPEHLPTKPRNPFPGLRPFKSSEYPFFFGREKHIDSMINILTTRRFLAVVGTSGSGKSSLVNCGLQPALEKEQGLKVSAGRNWHIARFCPENNPIQNLAKSLAEDGVLFSDFQGSGLTLLELVESTLRMSTVGILDIVAQALQRQPFNLLIVVDQFEELFRYLEAKPPENQGGTSCRDEASAFVSLLLAVQEARQEQIHIVLTMRSDFLGNCPYFPGLAEAINDSLYLVPRLTRQERRAAITEPVRIADATICPALVTRLVNDVGDDPDQLPILQHALRRTWDHWLKRSKGHGPLLLEDYVAIGTMATALDEHAKEALTGLVKVIDSATGSLSKSSAIVGTDANQSGAVAEELTSRMFKALTIKDSNQRCLRHPVTLGDLKKICGGNPDDVEKLVLFFSRPDIAFLKPVDDDPKEETWVDISHESLMRKWEKLRVWMDEEAKSADQFRLLASDAQRHEQSKRYLADPELQLALNWQRDERPSDDWALRYAKDKTKVSQVFDFLEKSRVARKRRRRLTYGAGALGVLVPIVLSLVYWKQWQDTRLSRARAYAAIAAVTLEDRPLQSMLYSLAALERLAEDPAESLGAFANLARATWRNWEVKRWDINPDGARRHGISALLALRDGKHQAISAAGCSQGSTEHDSTGGPCVQHLQQWNGSDPVGQPQPTGLNGRHQRVTALLELADGRIVSGGCDGSLRLWQLRPTLQPLTPPEAPLTCEPGAIPAEIHSLVQVSDGEIVSGDDNGRLRRWRLVGQGKESRLEPLGEPIATDVSDVKLLRLPNGTLLSGGADRHEHPGGASVQAWNLGRPIGPPLRTGLKEVNQLLLWDDQVLILGSEGTVVSLNPTTGTLLPLGVSGDDSSRATNNQQPSDKQGVKRLAVVDGGRALLSLHGDGTLRLWQRKGNAARTAGLELLAQGQTSSLDLRLLQALPTGEVLAADTNDQLLLIHAPAASAGEWERSGALTSSHQGVDALLAVSDDRLVSGDSGTSGKLCFWKLGKQPETLPVRIKGARGACLRGILPTPDADHEPLGVSLTPLPNGGLLSATNLSSSRGREAGRDTVLVQRWQPSTGRREEDWTVERLATPKTWSTITALSPAGGADVLVVGLEQPRSATLPSQDSATAKLWRWHPLQPTSRPLQLQPVGAKVDSVSWLAAAQPGKEWLTGSEASGALQRWSSRGPNNLRLSETITDTGLEAISALAILPGGRYAVIARSQDQQEGLIQVFDLVEKTWVGQPISLPRPLGKRTEPVAATALAILPEGGLAIGTNRNPAQLMVIQPRWILKEACNELQHLLDVGDARQSNPSRMRRMGLPPAVIPLARQACRQPVRG